MAGEGAIRVRGLAELQRDLRRLSAEVARELAGELRDAADPVRESSEQLARTEITSIASATAEIDWSRMRIGVSGRVVWVAPATRRTVGPPRGRFGPMLIDRAMQPALERHRGEILQQLERMLDRLAGGAGF